MKGETHKIRMALLLDGLIRNGFLSYDGQNIKTTPMTDHLIKLYKNGEKNTPLMQLAIEFEDER